MDVNRGGKVMGEDEVYHNNGDSDGLSQYDDSYGLSQQW